jgi:hypothetical protein
VSLGIAAGAVRETPEYRRREGHVFVCPWYSRSLSTMKAHTVVACFLSSALALGTGCRRGPSADESGAAPPPAAPSAKPGVCSSGGGAPSDALTAPFLPRVVGDYCIDPNGEVRAYGDDAKRTLDDVCVEQLDGECEVYKSYGLRRVVTLRYVDGAGSPGSIAVTLSRFASKEGAFGFYSKRVIADSDPANATLTELSAGAAASLGSGVAYVFRGEHLVELSYTNEAETPDQMRESGKRVLPGVATAIGARLPGEATLPADIARLPVEHRLTMGVAYVVGNVLDISGLGGGAVGYYRDGEKRFRILSLGRSDDDAAGDVLETIKKIDHASALKELPFTALAFGTQASDTAPRTEWVAGRKGNHVFAVGDEELVLGGGRSNRDQEHVKLTRDEKIAWLKKLVSGS